MQDLVYGIGAYMFQSAESLIRLFESIIRRNC